MFLFNIFNLFYLYSGVLTQFGPEFSQGVDDAAH